MLKLLRLLLKVPLVIAAALIGNHLGYLAREQWLGKSAQNLRLYQENEEGEITIAINPVFTNFLPAILAGLLSKPGWLNALFVGALVAAYLGDDYEDEFWRLFGIE